MIKVQDVVKLYGSFEAVSGVSFEVRPGEIVGLLGPNGAGKTTIMQVLTCYHFPSSGMALVNGHDVYDDPLAVKAATGYLPESAPLYHDMTVSEYLQFMAAARMGRARTQHERDTRIEWVTEKCGLEAVFHRSISDISKGYRQRTCLAQAILHDPAVLILDEPTSGLDPNQIVGIRSLIRELGREKTVILSTHILQEVEAICDRVIIISNGHIAAIGATDEIAAQVKGSGGELYIARFKAATAAVARKFADEQSFRSALATMPSFKNTHLLTRSATEPVWEAHFTLAGDGSGETVFDWALHSKLKIIELTRKRYSLEEVFSTLTNTKSSEMDEKEGEA